MVAPSDTAPGHTISLDGETLRRALFWGATRGPEWFVRSSPSAIGASLGLASPRKRALVLRNLRMVHGVRPRAAELSDVALTFATYGAALAEAIRAAELGAASIERHEVGGPRLLEALDEGRGVVVATAHSAGWELGSGAMRSRRPAPVMLVMEPEANPHARALQDAARARLGASVLHIGRGELDALPALRHLRAGGVLALQTDRVPAGGRACAVSLFGQPFLLPEGPLRLASLAGAPLVLAFSRRLGFLSYEHRIVDVVRLSRRPTHAELGAAAARVARALEAWLAHHVTQWFHFA